jgi:hypothetical protein
MDNENLTRLFFVVEGEESNQELFETKEEADACYNFLTNFGNDYHAKMYIAMVKNTYRDPDSNYQWSYEDLADTFEIIKYF